MIQSDEQYRKALEELHYLEEWLGRLQSESQTGPLWRRTMGRG